MILGHLHAQQRRIRLVRERQHLGVVAVPGNGGMMARIVWRSGPPEQLQLRITRAAVAPDAANARAGINGLPAVVNAVAALGDPGVPTVHIDNISKDALLAVGFEEPVLESNIFTGRTVLVALRPDAEPVQVTVGDNFVFVYKSTKVVGRLYLPFGLSVPCRATSRVKICMRREL